MHLDLLIDWFLEVAERARLQGVPLESIQSYEVSAWSERICECQSDLDWADEMRKCIPLPK